MRLSPNASLKARSGMRVVAGWNVLIKKISDKMYFGYEEKFFEDIEELRLRLCGGLFRN